MNYSIGVIVLVVVCLLLLMLVAFKHGKRTFIKRKLSHIAIDSLKDVELTDAVGDSIVVDYLLLQPKKIIVVTVLPYEGNIFASEKLDQWTQALKAGSYKFSNPYYNFPEQIDAVKRAIPDANVECKVLFSAATFPKDKPDAVWLMSDVLEAKQYQFVHIKDVASSVNESWRLLKGLR